MSRIEELRLEVRKRRSAVTAKENRIYRNTGIDLKNTNEDPRRAPSVIKKYNTNQLNNYLTDLNNFMMRENGYIADSSGGFIKKRDWLKYKRSERKYNKIVAQHFEGIGDILDPYRNVTIREAEQLFIPNLKRAQGEIKHRPLNEINRNPQNIKNAKALKKLQDQVEGRLDKNYVPKALAAGRKQAGQMLDNAGLSGLKNMVSRLNNRQFDVLWNYWGFAGRLAQIGSSGGNRSKNVEERNDPLDAQEKDNIKEDIEEFIKSASELKFDESKNKIINKNLSNQEKNIKIRASFDRINKSTDKE